jgi:glycosyltransferase involved in cell wall biosynthesis
MPLLYDIALKCPDLFFKIAGMPGKNIDIQTKNSLNGLKKLTNVEFVGYLSREQVSLFLLKASALLNTSHYEGFSNTYLEAFSTGTPVIAPTNADPDNIITKNRLGIAVKNNSDFPDVIQSLYDNLEKSNTMSKRCREYVYKNHNPEILAKKLTDIIAKN